MPADNKRCHICVGPLPCKCAEFVETNLQKPLGFSSFIRSAKPESHKSTLIQQNIDGLCAQSEVDCPRCIIRGEKINVKASKAAAKSGEYRLYATILEEKYHLFCARCPGLSDLTTSQ